MSTITDFLLARIADDEEKARAASPGGWQYGTIESVAGGTLYDETRSSATSCPKKLTPTATRSVVALRLLVGQIGDAAHIAHWHPARVLAECKAKRRVIGQHPHELNADDTVRRCSTCRGEGLCGTLRALAAVYADHPDYRPEWRP